MSATIPRRAAAVAMFATLITLCGAWTVAAQPRTYALHGRLDAPVPQSDLPLSNSAIDLKVRHDSVWAAGGKGLDLTVDGGRTWTHFGSVAPFDNEDVAALAIRDGQIWVSLAGSEKMSDGSTLAKGAGLAMSTDGGASWKRIAQPQEQAGDTTYIVTYGNNRLKALAVTTTINNITYDIAVTPSAVWTASFAGGLRRSTDNGATWRLVVLPPDNLDHISEGDTLAFDLSPVDRPDFWSADGSRQGLRGNLNYRVFSVMAQNDSTIWVGTAAGINRTTDGGRSWRRFSFNNQVQAISGNFVVALGSNNIGNTSYVWAATINALDPLEYRAVSFTSDDGDSWTTALRGEFTNNFGFKGGIVYAATNDGIFRSDDAGRTWSQFDAFIDPQTRSRAVVPNCYAAASQSDTVWIAGADGLYTTVDGATRFFGTAWKIFHAAQPLASPAAVYAYPNPFSPADDVCRVHYRTDASGSVTMEVYDFGMFPVRALVRNAARPPNRELDEIWDGRKDDGSQAANGIYYIKVTAGGGEAAWAKVVVLQ